MLTDHLPAWLLVLLTVLILAGVVWALITKPKWLEDSRESAARHPWRYGLWFGVSMALMSGLMRPATGEGWPTLRQILILIPAALASGLLMGFIVRYEARKRRDRQQPS